MGDRTTVTLTVLTSQAKLAVSFFDDDWDESLKSDLLSSYIFNEVNYGELQFLDALQTAGISYLSEWESGDEYAAGCVSCRFTPEGEAVYKELYDSDKNPSISSLLELIDNPHRLRNYILAHKESTTVLPWDNQEEYGKLYRATMLITT